MLKLSKKVEYAILAMQYMAMKDDLVTAKQIASDNNLSFEFLAKSLQCLNKKGLINSVQGIKGGYNLAKNPKSITVADVIKAMDQKAALVDCTIHLDADNEDCERVDFCILKNPMMHLQSKINSILRKTTIYELTKLAKLPESNGDSFINMNEIEMKN